MARRRRCQGLCRGELVKIIPPGLEADSRQHLEGARPARTKRLDDARSSLAKCRRAQQEIVLGQLQVGDVEGVEHFAGNRESGALFVCELLAQTEVGVEERVTEPIVRRQR